MSRRGFTLIELLIVIAIILILIAIALPNFLEAQIRAKVARLKADARSLAIACESYQADHQQYPYPHEDWYLGDITWDARQKRLTTPIRYMTRLPEDVFRSEHPHNPNCLFDLEVRGGIPDVWFSQDPVNPLVRSKLLVYIRSWGPDLNQEVPPWSTLYSVYNPTNGTTSRGDMWAVLPGPIYYP